MPDIVLPIGDKLSFGRADQNPYILERFYKGYRESFETNNAPFFNLAKEEVAADGAWLSIVTDGKTGRTVAGVRALRDGADTLFFTPCYALEGSKGKGLVPLQMAFMRALHVVPELTGLRETHSSRLFVRLINGEPNEPAVRAYRKIGFELGRVFTNQIQGTRLDAHLMETSEDGQTYQTQEMTAQPGSVSDCLALAGPLFRKCSWTL